MTSAGKGLIVALVCAAIVTWGGACAGHHTHLAPTVVAADDSTDTAAVTVRIDNQAFADVDVYVIPTLGGIRTRLGTALGHAVTVFSVPANLTVGFSELRFIIDPIGGGDATQTESVTVSPGDEVDLTIPPQ